MRMTVRKYPVRYVTPWCTSTVFIFICKRYTERKKSRVKNVENHSPPKKSLNDMWPKCMKKNSNNDILSLKENTKKKRYEKDKEELYPETEVVGDMWKTFKTYFNEMICIDDLSQLSFHGTDDTLEQKTLRLQVKQCTGYDFCKSTVNCKNVKNHQKWSNNCLNLIFLF